MKNKYWKIIKSLRWVKDGNYTRISKELLSKYSLEEISKLQKFVREKRDKLCKKLNKYALSKGDIDYYDVSDDGFWDLTAHIVGLGQNEFEKVMKNPELARKRALNGDYEENFEYIFNLSELELIEES